MPLYLVMSILIEQNLEIHPFQDLLNWDNFDTIHWTMDMRMMFEEDTFNHIEFIFSMEFAKSANTFIPISIEVSTKLLDFLIQYKERIFFCVSSVSVFVFPIVFYKRAV